MARPTFISAVAIPQGTDEEPGPVAIPGGVPADATGVIYFAGGYQLGSIGLLGVTSNFTGEWTCASLPLDADSDLASGAYARITSAPGSPTFSPVFDTIFSGGPGAILAFYKDIPPTGSWIEDFVLGHGDNTQKITLTGNSNADCDALLFDSQDGGGSPPNAITGWTSRATQSENGQHTRVSTITAAPGSPTTSVTTEGEFYASALLAIVRGVTGGSGITGTLAATESGSDTLAAAGNVTVRGNLAASEAGSDTASLSGAVRVSGALVANETGSDTAALVGAVRVQGTLSATEVGSDTFAATGSLSGGINGSLNASETGSDSFAATGSVLVAGSLAASESGSDSAAITGVVPIAGALAASEIGSDTFSAIGTASSRTGTLNAVESGSDTAQILGEGVSPEGGRLGGFVLTDHESPLWWKRKPKAIAPPVAKKRIEQVAKAIDEYAEKKIDQGEPIRQREVREQIAPLLAEMPGFDWRPVFKTVVEFREHEAARLEAIAQIERIRAIEQDDEDVMILLMSF